MRRVIGLAVGVASVAVWACGGGGGGGGGTCNPSSTAAVAVTATGFSPVNVCVLPSGNVTFTNQDTTSHDIEFGGTPCPAASPGSIAAGASATATFPTAGNCSYHDSGKTGTAFTGIIAVSTGTVSGGGY